VRRAVRVARPTWPAGRTAGAGLTVANGKAVIDCSLHVPAGSCDERVAAWRSGSARSATPDALPAAGRRSRPAPRGLGAQRKPGRRNGSFFPLPARHRLRRSARMRHLRPLPSRGSPAARVSPMNAGTFGAYAEGACVADRLPRCPPPTHPWRRHRRLRDWSPAGLHRRQRTAHPARRRVPAGGLAAGR